MSAHVPPMPAAGITGSLVALLLALSAPASAQPSSQATDTGRGLSIRFADGKVVTRALRPTGGMWAPDFPRIAGADTSRDGVPLSALDVRHVVEGADVVVTVTLYYGGVYKNPLKVATVRVSAGSPVQVKKLRAHGVEPITLSLVSIPDTVAYVPEAVSASAQLDVRVEPVGPNVSAYRVVMANRSRVPLMWIHFTGLRAGKELTGGRKGKRNVPLVAPGEEYVFEIAIGGLGRASGDTPEAWQPIDRVVITSLIWEDGLVEGDPVAAKRQATAETNRQAQIGRFVALLRAAPGQPLATLRAGVARSMGFDLETREARDGVLADLDAFERTSRSRDGRDFETWLAGTAAEHEQWLARIVIPKT
jgi:hypothetical protein